MSGQHIYRATLTDLKLDKSLQLSCPNPLHNPKYYPKNEEKGKVFLVNETFIRVDGVNYVNIRANRGRMRSIEVNSGYGKDVIITPLCQGYALAPDKMLYMENNGLRYFRRCMTPKELKEAEEDYYYVRPKSYAPYNVTWQDPILWVEYYHKTKSLGETNAADHLLAFNKALQEKRQEYAETHPGYKYEELIQNTYSYNPKFKLGND